MSTIEREVREFLRDTLFISDADILSDDDSFLEQGVLDSMGILHLIAFVEEKYGIHAEDRELVTDNWDSVSRMSRYIRSKLGSTEAVPEPPAVPSEIQWAA